MLPVSQPSPTAGCLLLSGLFSTSFSQDGHLGHLSSAPAYREAGGCWRPCPKPPPPSAGRPWAPCGLCAQGLLCTDSFPPTKRPQATSQGKPGSQRSRPRVHMLTPPQMGPKVGWSAKACIQPRLARQQEDTQMPCQGVGRGLAPPSTRSRAGSWPHPGTLWAAMLLPPSGLLHLSPGTEVGAGLLSVACFTLVTDLPGLRS